MTAIPILTVLSSFVVAIVAAMLAFRLNSRLEERKGRIAARNLAYTDFLIGIVEARAAQVANDDAAMRASMMKVITAKFRIGLHGSAEVVEAVIAFESNGEDASDARANDAFLEVYEKMRTDGLDANVTKARLSALAFGMRRTPPHPRKPTELDLRSDGQGKFPVRRPGNLSPARRTSPLRANVRGHGPNLM